MRNRKLAIAALMTVGVASGMACHARAQQEPAHLTNEEFVTVAARSGLAEVQLAKLAETRAARPEVQAFARRMLDDHTQANQKLKDLAEQKGILMPSDLDQEHQDAAAALSQLDGEAFDREYLRGQVKDHREAVALFATEATQTEDEDLKSFATETLPILREHLRMVTELAGPALTDEM